MKLYSATRNQTNPKLGGCFTSVYTNENNYCLCRISLVLDLIGQMKYFLTPINKPHNYSKSAAVFAHQLRQCGSQFRMPVFQFCRRRIKTLQCRPAQMQAVDLRLRRRLRHDFDYHILNTRVQFLKLRHKRGQYHFQSRGSHTVYRQQHQPALFDAGDLKVRMQVCRKDAFDCRIQPAPLLRLLQQTGQPRIPLAQLFQIHMFQTTFSKCTVVLSRLKSGKTAFISNGMTALPRGLC